MKCVKSMNGEIRRVSEEVAAQLINGYQMEKGNKVSTGTAGKWAYCPKHEWKDKRDRVIKSPVLPVLPTESPAPTATKKGKKTYARKAIKANVADPLEN